ncbi:MAG: hypothetical protein ACP5SA_00335 [Candidatus Micrarchaeia archaeon]
MAVNFEIPSRRSTAALLRTNKEKLEEIARKNDMAWEAFSNPVAKIANLLRDACEMQNEIKIKEEKFKELKEKIIEEMGANEELFKNFISYDEYNNVTISFNKDTLKELYPILGNDVVISLFENIMPLDKAAQKTVLDILIKQFGYKYSDFTTISNFKISDVLKKIKSEDFDSFTNLFLDLIDENTVIRLTVKQVDK